MLRNWQLLIAIIWGVIALTIALREPLGLPVKAYSDTQWTTGLVMALLLGAWNVVRWAARRAAEKSRSVTSPPEKRPAPKYEYNPEFDFQKMERDQRGPSGG